MERVEAGIGERVEGKCPQGTRAQWLANTAVLQAAARGETAVQVPGYPLEDTRSIEEVDIDLKEVGGFDPPKVHAEREEVLAVGHLPAVDIEGGEGDLRVELVPGPGLDLVGDRADDA